MRVLLIFVLMIFTISTVVLPVGANEILTGKTVDSVTGLPVSGVTVKLVSPACSTVTDATGTYNFNLITTNVSPIVRKNMVGKIIWNSRQQNFFVEGIKDYEIKIVTISGENIATFSSGGHLIKQMSPGNYLAVYRTGSLSGVFKFLNFSGNDQVFSVEGSIESQSLKKATANIYSASFSKTGYNVTSAPLSPGVSAQVLLSPSGVKAVIKIDSSPIDTLTVITIFN